MKQTDKGDKTTSAMELDLGGSTSIFRQLRQGVILKQPRPVWKESSAYQSLTKEIAREFTVERGILGLLGEHPRIVRLVPQHLHFARRPSSR